MAGPAASAFGLGASGISGNQANDSAEVARIDTNGYKLPAFTFAQLPAAPNRYIVFCVDCNTTCTWGFGKGRTCFWAVVASNDERESNIRSVRLQCHRRHVCRPHWRCELHDISAPGGQIKIGGPYSHLSQVFVDKPDQAINVGGTTKRIPRTFFRNSGGSRFYSGITQKNKGTKPICWSYGQNGGGQSANDVCIGIRTDNSSLNSSGRAVLGILGTVGPVTPFGTNQPGVDFRSAEASLRGMENREVLACASEDRVARAKR